MTGRVSLILPLAQSTDLLAELVGRCREALEREGHATEVIAVIGPFESLPDVRADLDCVWEQSNRFGLAAAAFSGLARASGDFYLVLDPTQGYLPEDLPKLIAPIAAGEADLVVAQREERTAEDRTRLGPRRTSRGWVGRLVQRSLGTSDPLSGLVAIRPSLFAEMGGTYRPVGSRFAVDLLLRSKGRKAEVTVRTEAPRSGISLEVDDLRHLKRLADDRFGNASRLLQFCAVGASGMVVDLTFYAIFQALFGETALSGMATPLIGGPLDLAAAGAMSIAIALTWNFFLNRRLTFNDARFGSIPKQYLAYAMSNALGIALSLSLRLVLPKHVSFFERHKLAAAVVGIVTATGISFTLARRVVFRKHRKGPRDEGPGVVGSGSGASRSFGR